MASESYSIILEAGIIIIGLLCLLMMIIKLFFIKHQLSSCLPKGSMGWPLLGETIGFLRSHKSTSLGTFLQDHCKRYGNVFKSHLFGRPTIVSCDLDLNNFVLQNEEKFFETSYPKPVHDILGKLSMMLVTGELHKKLRSTTLLVINEFKSAPNFIPNIENLTVSLLDSWKQRHQIQLFSEAKKFTFYLMIQNLLEIEPSDPLASRILEDFLTFMKGFVSLPLYVPGTAYTRAVKARARISSTLKSLIKKRENLTEVDSERNNNNVYNIFRKRELNDEEKVSILLDILLAGYETTSGLLALIIFFLSRESRVLEQLRQEHQTLRGRKQDGELLSWDDLKQMNFTFHVINEAMRCGNLVKFLHRKALKDVTYKGILIPAGWQILPILSAPHLDPSLHQNPLEFNPWRWEEDKSIRKKVNPLGGGLRLCPGADIGKLEAAIFLHHLLINYRWTIKEDDCPMSCPYLDFAHGLSLEIKQLCE